MYANMGIHSLKGLRETYDKNMEYCFKKSENEWSMREMEKVTNEMY